MTKDELKQANILFGKKHEYLAEKNDNLRDELISALKQTVSSLNSQNETLKAIIEEKNLEIKSLKDSLKSSEEENTEEEKQENFKAVKETTELAENADKNAYENAEKKKELTETGNLNFSELKKLLTNKETKETTSETIKQEQVVELETVKQNKQKQQEQPIENSLALVQKKGRGKKKTVNTNPVAPILPEYAVAVPF